MARREKKKCLKCERVIALLETKINQMYKVIV